MPSENTEKPTAGRQDFKQFFFQLIMELVDVELGFMRAQDSYKTALVEKGININIDDLVNMINMVNNRAERILAAKQISAALGLHHETDLIVQAEIALMMGRQIPSSAPPTKPTGDKRFK